MIQLLNITLLSLTTATILLTLVSYTLYKTKQLPREQKRRLETRKVEGTFFRRYVPGEAATEVLAVATEAPKGWFRPIPQTTTSFFVIVASVIFVALLAQYFVNLSRRGNFLSDSERRDLMSRGLLKQYKLAKIPTDHLLEEYIFPQQNARLKSVVGKLRGKKIVLLQSATNRASDHRKQMRSLEHWSDFLERLGIPCKISGDLSAVRPGVDLVILPRPYALSKTERKAIDNALDKGVSFLATGSVAADSTDWTQKTFGVRLIPNPMAGNRYPTLFVSGTSPWWDIPAGIEASWFPDDTEFKAVGVVGTSALYEGDYKGFFNGIEGYPKVTEVTRAQFIQGKQGRAAWLASDPIASRGDLTEAEFFYVRSALIHSLAWASGVPSARVSSWKGGHKSAMVVWVDTEDKFENIDAMADSFKHSGFPGTFFVVSNLFQTHPGMMSHMTDGMEVGSHSENHKSFNLQTVEEQFDRIQISRHETERISRRPVLGFRPPTEKCGPETVSAVLQNGLQYIAGDRTYMRYAPTWIAGGKLAFFSRTMFDDINFKRSGLMEEPGDFIATAISQCDHVGKFNGLYLLGLHTQNFGEGQPLEILAGTLEALGGRNYWRASFADVYEWIKNRMDLETDLSPDGEVEGRYLLTVANNGDQAVIDFGVDLDTGSARGLQLAGRPLASEESGVKLVVSEGTRSLMIGRIDPKQTLTVALESKPGDEPVAENR